MAHRSALGGFIIDCETDDLAGAAAFWAGALGDTRPPIPEDERYAVLQGEPGLHVEVQKVGHESRIHLDIATDDVAAEVARLTRLGARTVKAVRDWVVMEAPTGHRFCVVPAPAEGFADKANLWDDPAP